jgi:hypothetical protein
VAKWDTVCAIKYHGWWPGANNDPMFLANVSQNRNRIQYYGVSGVPDGNFDGTFLHVFPYSPETQLSNPYYSRLSKGTPLSLTVTDTRIAGDTIKASITLNILSPLMAGNYRLRINAIERTRTYIGGSNGETVFKDIFRKMYPDSNGISIPTAAGIYNYEYKYKRETEWIDSLIYTVVFVQNDVSKEVMNCNKARNYLVDRAIANNMDVKKQINKQTPSQRTDNTESGKVIIQQPCTDEITAGFNFESFESGFPPSGWQVVNGNAGSITWEGYTGANGPLIGGTKSARMNFYAYSSQGHIDYLKSRIYNNIDLTDSLKFNWAYAQYPGYSDRMQVQVSTNGGSTYPFTIFDRTGPTLATAPSTSSDFVPVSASEWGRFSIAMSTVLTAIQKIGTEIPSEFKLIQNYPNPFNPVTNISYMIPANSHVSLKVYNVKGQVIATLYEGNQNPGIYITNFDASNLSSGVYFYALEAGNFKDVKKMALIK